MRRGGLAHVVVREFPVFLVEEGEVALAGARPHEVDDGDVGVARDEVGEVPVEGAQGGLEQTLHTDLVRAHLQAGLRPEQRHRPPDLHVAQHLLLHHHQLQAIEGDF